MGKNWKTWYMAIGMIYVTKTIADRKTLVKLLYSACIYPKTGLIFDAPYRKLTESLVKDASHFKYIKRLSLKDVLIYVWN